MDKYTIKTIAASRNQNIKSLAKDAGITPESHLNLVSCGRATMTASDLIKIHLLTGIPVTQIVIDYRT